MSCTYFGANLDLVLARALPLTRHIHLGDAAGVDGEGVALGQGDVGSSDMLPVVLRSPYNKVLEVWQGHLSRGEGFKSEIAHLFAQWGHL